MASWQDCDFGNDVRATVRCSLLSLGARSKREVRGAFYCLFVAGADVVRTGDCYSGITSGNGYCPSTARRKGTVGLALLTLGHFGCVRHTAFPFLAEDSISRPGLSRSRWSNPRSALVAFSGRFRDKIPTDVYLSR